MKKNSILFAFIFSLLSLSSYANNLQVDTVAIAKSKINKSNTILTGTITKAIDKDEFMLKDTSGEINIKINLLKNEEKSTLFKNNPALVGANVVIEGILDKKTLEPVKINVSKIDIIFPPISDPFMNVINSDFSEVQSIRVAKSLNHKSQVLLYGVVVQILGNDEFLLRDNEGGDIKVKLDFPVKGEEISFMKQYQSQLNGSNVVVQGFLDKEFMEKIKVDANRIQITTVSNNDPFANTINKNKSINR